MRDLTVTVIQPELAWEDIHGNLEMFSEKMDQADEKTDLVVLPEMFTTGFSMNPQDLAQTMGGSAVSWMKGTAKKRGMEITGSLVISDGGKYYNRLVWVKPSGELFTYDKKHLFRYAGEDKVYTAGDRHLTVTVKGWKIRPFICYDLRFPMWTRNCELAYDVGLFVANWPESRSHHWKSLLVARAIENQVYVIGVNRVGQDGNNIIYSGDTSVIDPQGRIFLQESHVSGVYSAVLSRRELDDYRRSFPAWMDGDMVEGSPKGMLL